MPEETKQTLTSTPTPTAAPQVSQTQPTSIKVADVMLTLSKEGHHVHLTGVTPAELLLLCAEHAANAGGDPVVTLREGTDVQEQVKDEKTGEVKTVTKRVLSVDRSNIEEIRRLRGKYAGNKITALFPGTNPNLPTSFDEVRKLGPGLSLPTSKLTEVKLY